MLRVVHFEIHASDPERAAKFYANVFGWEIKEWKFPIPMADENRYWMVMTKKEGEPDDSKWGGINGGMIIRKGPEPKAGDPVNSYVCTMDVPSVDEYITKITGAGGLLALPKMAIPSVGWLAYCKDTESNIFGIMQNDPSAK